MNISVKKVENGKKREVVNVSIEIGDKETSLDNYQSTGDVESEEKSVLDVLASILVALVVLACKILLISSLISFS